VDTVKFVVILCCVCFAFGETKDEHPSNETPVGLGGSFTSQRLFENKDSSMYLEGKLELNRQIAYGDFEVSVTFDLEKSDKGSFALAVGADNFLFDMVSKELVSKGNEGSRCFFDKPLKYDISLLISEGKPIKFDVFRKNHQMTLNINSRTVYENQNIRDTIGLVTLESVNMRSKILDFSAAGRFIETCNSRKTVFSKDENGYSFFRIPAILNLSDGVLLAFAEGRKDGFGDHGDIDTVMKRSTDGGESWGDFTIVYERGGDKNITVGNPCPIYDRVNNRVLLFIHVTEKWGSGDFEFLSLSSEDKGLSWSEPVNIKEQVIPEQWAALHPGPGHGIQIFKGQYRGRLIVPFWFVPERAPAETRKFRSSFIYSDDFGKTWQKSESALVDTDETLVAEASDGSLVALLRPFYLSEDVRYMKKISQSNDGGKTWSEAQYHEGLKSVICQTGLLSRPDIDERIFFSYPGAGNYDGGNLHRGGMTILSSRDKGKSWQREALVYPGRSAYSDMMRFEDENAVGVLYECGQYTSHETISFSKVQLND
jgi:sialidase-1